MASSRLVIAPNWIGDAVMALPFLRSIRRSHPNDSLTVLALDGPGAVFRAEGSADGVIVRSEFLRDILRLRRSRFDEAWLLPNSLRAAFLAFLGGIPTRIGYDTDRRGALLTHALPLPPRTGHQLRDYDLLLSSRGIEPDLEPPRLPIPAQAAGRAARALESAGLPRDGRLVLLAPGAASGWPKRWPPERYACLADRLADRGLPCGVVVGPNEKALGARVTHAARRPPPLLGADLDPVELAGVLSHARLVVSNDSGPMHLAAAVGTPVVAFFGPTDPGRTAPAGASSRILNRYVFCSPCYLNECPYGHECMKEITVEDALRAVEEVLSSR